MPFELDEIGANLILGRAKEPYVVDVPRVAPTFLQSDIDRQEEALGKEVGRQRPLRQTMPVP